VLTLPPTLTHDLAAGFAGKLRELVSAQPKQVMVDAGGLQNFDSSALAILLECRRETLAAGKAFAVLGLPARLRQLAGLYGVAELIPAAA
jgi:phospholipid transport system transporter-binding protein